MKWLLWLVSINRFYLAGEHIEGEIASRKIGQAASKTNIDSVFTLAYTGNKLIM